MPRRHPRVAKTKLRGADRWEHALVTCAACDKYWYTSFAQAQRMALKALNERDTRMFIYYCPVDPEKYHLTKMEEHDDRGEVL